jgi:rare lipoprotein A
MVAMNILHLQFKSFCVPLTLFLILQGCSLFSYKERSVLPINIAPTSPVVLEKPPEAIEKKRSAKVQVGKASWYGANFQGKRTASGAVFDQNQQTAAHRTFPLGSRVRVTRLDNNKSVEVEITDRGPFVDGRIIDLSRAAAASLGMLEEGTVTVRVELLRSTSVRQTASQP